MIIRDPTAAKRPIARTLFIVALEVISSIMSPSSVSTLVVGDHVPV